MRLWSVHPRYLDTKGLTACWREALLAQRVLAGQTRGYRNHPQLVRFRAVPSRSGGPRAAIESYLGHIAAEAGERGFHFDAGRIGQDWPSALAPELLGAIRLRVTSGQLDYELTHLTNKLATRDPQWLANWPTSDRVSPRPHPIFDVVPGDVEVWERPIDDA